MLFPLLSLAQKEKATTILLPLYEDSIPQTAFFLKKRNVFFQKVFTSDLRKEELADKIYTLLNTKKAFRMDKNIFTNDGDFFGRLSQHKFDPYKYDAGSLSTPGVLAYPINATVAIQIKDYKYRVTITEVNFKEYKKDSKDSLQTVDILLDDYVTQKNRSKIKLSKSNAKLAAYLDRDFTDLFDLNSSIISGDF